MEADDLDAPTARDEACFEAGIKLGAVFHQFIGTPVTPETADTLAEAMANAMEAQPACRSATVRIDASAVDSDANRFGYTGLAGDHFEAAVTIEHDGVLVAAELVAVDDYPLMRLVGIDP